MTFSTFKRRSALGWFRDIEEGGRPMPGTRAVATHLMLEVDQADALVQELASEGLIELYRANGSERVRVMVVPGQLTAAVGKPAPEKEYQGASGTARKAPSAVGSPTAARTTGRIPHKEPAVETPPARLPDEPVVASGPHDAAPRFERGHKPRISAEIIRAARERGQPLDAFVTALINIGFAEHRRSQIASEILP